MGPWKQPPPSTGRPAPDPVCLPEFRCEACVAAWLAEHHRGTDRPLWVRQSTSSPPGGRPRPTGTGTGRPARERRAVGQVGRTSGRSAPPAHRGRHRHRRPRPTAAPPTSSSAGFPTTGSPVLLRRRRGLSTAPSSPAGGSAMTVGTRPSPSAPPAPGDTVTHGPPLVGRDVRATFGSCVGIQSGPTCFVEAIASRSTGPTADSSPPPVRQSGVRRRSQRTDVVADPAEGSSSSCGSPRSTASGPWRCSSPTAPPTAQADGTAGCRSAVLRQRRGRQCSPPASSPTAAAPSPTVASSAHAASALS